MLTRKIIAGITAVLFAVASFAEAEVRDVKAIGEAALRKGIITAPPAGHDFTKIQPGTSYKEGRLLVRFEPREIKGKLSGMSTGEKKQILDSLGGAKEKRSFDLVPGLSLVELPEGMTVEKALKKFNKKAGVMYAEPDYEVKACSTIPNDTRFGELWGMNNTGQTGGTNDADIDAPEAWDVSTGSSDIIVAVIDTGVDYTHPDLAANMWVNTVEADGNLGVDDDGNGYIDDIYGYDFCDGDSDPMDNVGHGTHCAGTIGAYGNNNEGVVGVCWNVRIMALRGLGGSLYDMIECIEYATLMDANLTNNSWEIVGGGYSWSLEHAIEASGEAGMLFVAAAGNSGEDNDSTPHYPSGYDCDNIIAVMATTHTDAPAYYTNYGFTSVDLGAPGGDNSGGSSDILSTLPGGVYGFHAGTSMAAPHVAGACALMWSVHPALSNIEVKNTILASVDKKSSLSGYCVSEGRLNLYNAVMRSYPKGAVSLDRNYYSCSDEAKITLVDSGLIGDGNHAVYVSTSPGGDTEIADLDELSVGIFKGTIYTYGGPVIQNDSNLQLLHGDTITVTYYDANDGSGNPAVANDTAEADCNGPIISNVEYDEIVLLPDSQTITFETDEVASVKVRYGTVCGGPNTIEVSNPSFSQQHSIMLTGLSSRTEYYFEIEATDLLGNTAIDNSDGNCYSFYTYPKNINVPGDFNTIQDAIDDSFDGCIIQVATGVYRGTGNRDIDFLGKAITIRSTNPNSWNVVKATIIDCNGSRNDPHCGFYFHTSENHSSVVDGFTITNGYGRYIAMDSIYAGGAICSEGSGSPTIRRCILKDNMNDKTNNDTRGGAIACHYGGDILVEDCNIYDNEAYYGGGISIGDDSSATLRNCMIWGNSADRGGGIDLFWGYRFDINNCTIVSNSASTGGGISNTGTYFAETITNCILWGNGDDLYDCNATFSCIQDGDAGPNNISSDPCFVDADSNNFHIGNYSPCVDAGDPNGNYNGQIDIDNSPRLLNQRVDIGADETGRVYNVNTYKAYDNIGDAMAEDSDGDEIVVYPGTYYENIMINNKITLRSTDPNDPCVVAITIIDGGGGSTTVEELEPDIVLKGFTIRNGSANGIYCDQFNTTISNCIIEGSGYYGIRHYKSGGGSPPPGPGLTVRNSTIRNKTRGISTDYEAGTIEENQIHNNIYGISAFYTAATIRNNHIHDNWTYGIYASGETGIIEENQIHNNDYGICYAGEGSTVTIRDNEIYGNNHGIKGNPHSDAIIERNKIYNNGEEGIYGEVYATGTIRNNLIYHNGYGIDAGFAWMTISNNTVVNNTNLGIRIRMTIYNCIVWNNGVDLGDWTDATYSCISNCDYVGDPNVTHNICSDPCFVDADSNNFHIDIHSPCVNAGNPNGDYEDQNDIDGEARVIGSYVDMGADEVNVPVSDAHQWGLDERSEAIAYDSVGDSNGTFNGSDPCWTDGLIGGAVDFNGVNDYFSVSSLDSAYNNNSVFTVAGWFKTDQSTGIQTIVGQWSQAWEAGQEYWGWQVLVENSKVVARFGGDLGTYDITGTTDVNVGEWHHFAMVRNGTSVAVYVDGQPKGSGTANFEVYNTKFRIGDGSYTFSYPPTLKGGPFDGMIDDVMLFNRVLSAGEVEQLYEEGLE